MAKLKENHLVKKRNILNEIRSNSMSLTELRFFAMYLSRINPAKPEETRVVRFPLDDFRAIMELSSRLNIEHMKSTTNSLLGKIVNVPTERGGYEGFQLFKKCKVDMDDIGEWFVEIDAHDQALPLMFDYKREYFSYPLFNILRLRSTNQIRMYELLRQYKAAGMRIWTIDELKKDLWLGANEHPRFGDFKNRVLDICQQALLEHTDIKFTYEPYGKKGKGGKVLALKFIIEKNVDYTDQLTLDMFIEEQRSAVDEAGSGEYTTYHQRIDLLSGACDDEFNVEEIKLLYGLLLDHEPQLSTDEIAMHDYLHRRFQYLNSQATKKNIGSRFGYLKSLIGKEI